MYLRRSPPFWYQYIFLYSCIDMREPDGIFGLLRRGTSMAVYIIMFVALVDSEV